MSTQIILLGITFIVFGIIAWIAQEFSIAYVGLMIFGLAGIGIGLIMRTK